MCDSVHVGGDDLLPHQNQKEKTNMTTIKIHNTEDGFDPSGELTPEQYDENLTAFECAVRDEIVVNYPDAEVEFFRDGDYGAPVGGLSVDTALSSVGYPEEWELESDIQRICETVWETGLFWL